MQKCYGIQELLLILWKILSLAVQEGRWSSSWNSCVTPIYLITPHSAGERGTESSFEKLQKMISADVKADVKQQEK